MYSKYPFIFKQFANKKQGILNKLIDSHEERLLGTLKKLEDDIIAELTKATSGGVNLTTQLAIQLRPNLKRLIEENFLKEVKAFKNSGEFCWARKSIRWHFPGTTAPC